MMRIRVSLSPTDHLAHFSADALLCIFISPFFSRVGRLFQHIRIYSAENPKKSPYGEAVCQIVIDIRKQYKLMQQYFMVVKDGT